MTQRGDTIENPVQGARVVLLEITGETVSKYVRPDVCAAPRGSRDRRVPA